MSLLDERIDNTKVWAGNMAASRGGWPISSSARQSQGFLLQCRYVATSKGWKPGMAITKLSSRDFNQDTSRAKRAAKRGPVFITDRGRPSHVLLTVEEYQRITQGQKSVVDLLAMPAAAEIEFEPPRLRGNLHEPADLT
jgi:prevent-host-death family protein